MTSLFKTRIKLVVAFSFISMLMIASFSQAALSPQQVIKNGAEEVRTILKKKTKKNSPAAKKQKEQLKKIVDGFLDYKELSRRSLGPHWKDRSAPEQDEFTKLLRDLIEASYTSSISNNINFSMEYEEEEIGEDGISATVIAIASSKTSKGKKVSEDLTFQLYLKSKKWMIYDVEFGDVSLVRHYRGEFNRKIKKESYKALITAMRKKLKEVKGGKLEKKPTL
jgi:phospholipid transport system substrate-binding protein